MTMRLKWLLNNKLVWLGFLFLVGGILINIISSYYLLHKFGDSLPVLKDFLLNNIPYYHIAWLSDFLAILPLVIFGIWACMRKPELMAYYLFVFGVIQYVRGAFIILTPMGIPNGIDVGLFAGEAFRNGLYPSGHTGASFMAYLLSNGWVRWVCLSLSIAVIVTLLLSRGHYSIDIFSALFFSYAIYALCENYLKPKLKIEKLCN